MGSEELDGRSREETWRGLQRRNPELRDTVNIGYILGKRK
jgi:hypothetical protein